MSSLLGSSTITTGDAVEQQVFSVEITETLQCAKLGFFSLVRGAMGLNNLMKISLALVTFSLARLHFHWPRAPGQLLKSHTDLIS